MNLTDKLKDTGCGMKDMLHDLWITSDMPHIKEDESGAYNIGMASGVGLQITYLLTSAVFYFPAIAPWFTVRIGTALNSIRKLRKGSNNGIKDV